MNLLVIQLLLLLGNLLVSLLLLASLPVSLLLLVSLLVSLPASVGAASG